MSTHSIIILPTATAWLTTRLTLSKTLSIWLNMAHRQQQQQWMGYANSQQEYENKMKERELKEMQLNSHQDLLSFYLLKKPANKTINMNDEQFNTMPDRYIQDIRDDIGCSLPTNFDNDARKGPPTAEQFANDKSLLATLLGGYNPPPIHLLSINPLDQEAIEQLTFPSNLRPKEVKKPSPTKQPPKFMTNLR